MTTERKKCTRCSVNLLLTDYNLKRNGNLMIRCKRCNEYIVQYNKAKKLETKG